MNKKISLTTSFHDETLICKLIGVDSSYFGKTAKFQLIIEVKVKDNRPVNQKKVLFTKKVQIQSSEEVIHIDFDSYHVYSYKGKEIDINILLEVTINDSIFFDTKIVESLQCELQKTSSIKQASSESIMSPRDTFEFWYNLKAIPHNRKIIVLLLTVIAGIIVTINSIVGLHDQFVIESQTWFYSHVDSDGESSSPFFNSLAGSGAIGAFVWGMIHIQLRKYMTFFFRDLGSLGDIGKKYKVRNMIGGRSRIDLKNTTLNIVACNVEKGQYKRTTGSGKRRRTKTVSFQHNINPISLYTEEIDFIPKGVDISEYIRGELLFDKLYKQLHPALHISSQHGLGIRWEVQLIHRRLIDQELVGENTIFTYEKFL